MAEQGKQREALLRLLKEASAGTSVHPAPRPAMLCKVVPAEPNLWSWAGAETRGCRARLRMLGGKGNLDSCLRSLGSHWQASAEAQREREGEMALGISSGNITHPLTRSGVPLSCGWHFLSLAWDWSDL